MSKLIQTKTSFTAGELSPDLLGRGDLAAYENGAARLRNVFINPTGGVTRRAGLRYLDTVPGRGRLVPFEFNTEQVYLLVFTHLHVDVFMDGAKAAGFTAPWTEAQLAEMSWTQSADTLLVVHPEVEPQRIRRSSHTAWTIGAWLFTKDDKDVAQMPFARIARDDLSLRTNGPTSGSVVIHADKPYFVPEHAGVHILLRGVPVRFDGYQDSQHMSATVLGTLPSSAYTLDWFEHAFSNAHGWPATVTFHQDRLVIGGSRDLPNHLWFSRSGDFFNFDPGTGLDDQGIDFPILSDQVNAIRAVFSGRHLQVFTTGAEWMVAGEPLTPTNIQVRRQTRTGSLVDRRIPPRDVDGATLFISTSGRELREYLFADSEQAYQAGDLALLARHLMQGPVDMDYDPVRRLVHLVMADGGLATVTNFRREQVTAWTRQETAGEFLAVCVAGAETYVLVARDGGIFLEQFDDGLNTDSGLTGTAATPQDDWSGLDHLEGLGVKVKADEAEVDDAVVTGGAVTLLNPASDVEIGLPFTHVVEPLPPSPEGPRGGGNGRAVRLVRVSLRLLETPVLKVDSGRGVTAVTFKHFGADGVLDAPPPPFTGDATVRALGWQRDAVRPLWRVEQDTPMPCTVLSVTTETKVTD